jgi:hypothetical protein
MSLNTIIENPEYKLLFLKAIKLGIMYGQSDKSNFYKEKIDSEIKSMMFSDEPLREDPNMTSKKNELIMMNLENQKNIIVKNIQNLSTNYSPNYSKINFLKNSLVGIMKEIDKYKDQSKNNSSQSIKKNITEIKRKDSHQNESLTNELQDTLNRISNLIIS